MCVTSDMVVGRVERWRRAKVDPNVREGGGEEEVR